jgi:hypothetical protein
MPDPSHPTSVAAWIGLLGKSTEGGYWRLYLNIEFDSYIEFKEEDVLGFDDIPAEQSPLGVEAARVYLESSARIKHARVHSWEGPAREEGGGVRLRRAPQNLGGLAGLRGTGSAPGVIYEQKDGGGDEYCGSEVITKLESMPGGGLQFCDFLRVCMQHPDGTTYYTTDLIEGSCTGNILEGSERSDIVRLLEGLLHRRFSRT